MREGPAPSGRPDFNPSELVSSEHRPNQPTGRLLGVEDFDGPMINRGPGGQEPLRQRPGDQPLPTTNDRPSTSAPGSDRDGRRGRPRAHRACLGSLGAVHRQAQRTDDPLGTSAEIRRWRL